MYIMCLSRVHMRYSCVHVCMCVCVCALVGVCVRGFMYTYACATTLGCCVVYVLLVRQKQNSLSNRVVLRGVVACRHAPDSARQITRFSRYHHIISTARTPLHGRARVTHKLSNERAANVFDSMYVYNMI